MLHLHFMDTVLTATYSIPVNASSFILNCAHSLCYVLRNDVEGFQNVPAGRGFTTAACIQQYYPYSGKLAVVQNIILLSFRSGNCLARHLRKNPNYSAGLCSKWYTVVHSCRYLVSIMMHDAR